MPSQPYTDQKQLLDTLRWYLLVTSLLAIALLAVLYILLPIDENSPYFHRLFIDIVPSAIVALAVIPAAYVFMYRHGLTLEQQFDRISSQLSASIDNLNATVSEMPHPRVLADQAEIVKHILNDSETPSDESQDQDGFDVLVAVDLQHDFIDPNGELHVTNAESLVNPINRAIRVAHSNGMPIVFTRDWHPKDHPQFNDFGTHCVENSKGAQIHRDVIMPENRMIFDFGIDALKEGYDPFENRALRLFLKSPDVRTVYVVGFALEYCVAAMCLGAAKLGKTVKAVEPLIGDTNQQELIATVWERLKDAHVERCSEIPEALKIKRE